MLETETYNGLEQHYSKTFIVEGSSDNKWEVKESYQFGLSCNCPSWKFRVKEDGSRNCKHIDLVKDYLKYKQNPSKYKDLICRLVVEEL